MGCSDATKRQILSTEQLHFVLFLAQQAVTCRVSNDFPRRSSVHSERSGYSSSIPILFCRTSGTKQRRRKAQGEDISLRSSLRNAILLNKHAMQIRSIWLGTIEDISKTIAGSDRLIDFVFFTQGRNKRGRRSKTIETDGNNEGTARETKGNWQDSRANTAGNDRRTWRKQSAAEKKP